MVHAHVGNDAVDLIAAVMEDVGRLTPTVSKFDPRHAAPLQHDAQDLAYAGAVFDKKNAIRDGDRNFDAGRAGHYKLPLLKAKN